MGLDLIEFTMAVEDAFGIVIPDAEAVDLVTPGRLVDYLVIRLPAAGQSHCREQRAFYALRQAGIRVLQVPRAAITPATAWTALLPERGRRNAWRVLHHAVGASKWPGLSLWRRLAVGQKTVGDTARYLATYVPGAWEAEGWSRADIEAVIRRLMAEELGIREFNWDQEFVRDLGCD